MKILMILFFAAFMAATPAFAQNSECVFGFSGQNLIKYQVGDAEPFLGSSVQIHGLYGTPAEGHDYTVPAGRKGAWLWTSEACGSYQFHFVQPDTPPGAWRNNDFVINVSPGPYQVFSGVFTFDVAIR
jgi:hypothetical protein